MTPLTTVTDFGGNQLEKASSRISQLFKEMVGHGFFRFEVSGSIGKGGKRVVIITAGKDYKYTIPVEDIPEMFLKMGGS